MRLLALIVILSAASHASAGPAAAAGTTLQDQQTAAPPTQAAVVESVIVHGNHTTPTDDVLAIAGAVTGQEATDSLVADVKARLEKSGRFAGIDVRRRFLSIDDPSRVLIVIVVNERPGVSEDDLMPGPMKQVMASGMWLPVLNYQEGTASPTARASASSICWALAPGSRRR